MRVRAPEPPLMGRPRQPLLSRPVVRCKHVEREGAFGLQRPVDAPEQLIALGGREHCKVAVDQHDSVKPRLEVECKVVLVYVLDISPAVGRCLSSVVD